MSVKAFAGDMGFAIECDECGEASEPADTVRDALDEAFAAGYVARKAVKKWEHYCPSCKPETLAKALFK